MIDRLTRISPRWRLAGSGRLDGEARIHREFERWVDRRPNATAIMGETRLLSYRELDERANHVASLLQEKGIGPGSIVMTCFHRSLEMAIGLLGVLKTGAAYLPVLPGTPAKRIELLQKDSGAQLILTEQTMGEILPTVGGEVLGIDGIKAKPRRRKRRSGGDAGGELASIIYTSGSTGHPKGALITHRGIVRLTKTQEYASFQPGQRFLLNASPAFDAIFFELWGPLMSGGTCVVFEGLWPELSRLENVIRSYDVTCVFLTTSLFNQIVDLRPQILDSVSEILVGGEALSVAHVRRAQARLPEVKLSNIYGPTECTTFACAGVITEPQMWGCDTVPIGRPISHTECHVVDERLQPVSVGEVGELLLGGPGLALGYLNRPELTEEKFIRHPWSEDPSDRLYRTGDLCRWLPNGSLEFVRRMDDQVKLRGFRIEPAEIERLAESCDGVAKAVAAVTEYADSHRQCVLFLVPKHGADVDTAQVRRELQSQLPEPMVPGSVETVARMPLNANGKIDRAALLRIWEGRQSVVADLPEGNGTEARLVRWWRKLLHRSDLGAESDFFAEGGDSLLAARLAGKLQDEFGHPVPVGAIFEHPTPARLSAHLDRGGAACSLQGDGKGAPLFCVPEIHGIGRLSPYLIQRLRGKRRYYEGLQYPGVDGGRPHQRVEDLAEALMAQVTAVYPEGPLCLYGFSYGGLVAFEMARRFAKRGRKVVMVVLGDAIPAGSMVPRGKLERNVWRVLDVLRWPWRDAPAKVVDILRSVRRTNGRGVPEKSYPMLCRTPVAIASFHAYGSYTPSTYAGRVGLVKCSEQELSPYFRCPPRRDYGWGQYVTGPLAVRTVQGGHMRLFDDEASEAICQLLEES